MGCQSPHSDRDPVGGKGYRHSRWIRALVDDGGTLSPPLPLLLASSRQVTPDGHATEAQPLGDLSDGQALLAEEDRLGTVVVGEAVAALQPCLPTQPVDRRAVDARLSDDLLDGDASTVQVDHLLALLGCERPELRLPDAANLARRP